MAKLEKVVKDVGGKVARTIFTVPISILDVIDEDDTRDRDTDRYLAHYQTVKAGIIQAGGIQDMLTGYRGKGEDDGTIFITNGRTRFYAALEALEDGVFGDDVTEDTFMVEVKVNQGSQLDHLGTQLRAQNSLDFTVTEKSNLIRRALRLAADNIEVVCKRLSLKKPEVQKYIDFDSLPEQVKALINQGTVKLTTALDCAKDHSDDELINILTTAAEIKEEKNADTTKAKGKGYKSNQLTKTDIYIAKLKRQGDEHDATVVNNQRDNVVNGVALDGFDPFVLNKINKLVESEIKRLTVN